MRISVPNKNESSLALQGLLRKAGYAISDQRQDYTVFLDEHSDEGHIVVDGIDCPLENRAVKMISHLSDTRITLARAGGIASDKEIHISFHPKDAEAVEKGVFRAILKETRTVAAPAPAPTAPDAPPVLVSSEVSIEDVWAENLKLKGEIAKLLEAEASERKNLAGLMDARLTALRKHADDQDNAFWKITSDGLSKLYEGQEDFEKRLDQLTFWTMFKAWVRSWF